ncbi:hypothetical protein J7K93_02235 [bacterium]|nr:hypothetical protein [bacterium]
MIVKMKKVTLLVSSQNRDNALYKLRKLGILDIKRVKSDTSEDLNELAVLKSNLIKSIAILDNFESGKSKKQKDIPGLINEVVQTDAEISKANSRLQELEQTAGWFEYFGRISRGTVETLRERGVFVTFYQTDKAGLKNIPAEKEIHIAKEHGSMVFCALFSSSPDDKLDFKEMAIPEVEPDVLEKEIRRQKEELKSLTKKLQSFASFKSEIADYDKVLEKKIEFIQVKSSMGDENEFAFLQGFCPFDVVGNLKENADKEGWAYIIEDPDVPEDVPTLLRNPRWMSIVQPLFDFMGTLPGYKEIDVSLVFLCFFSLFYAILIGDAGYGFVFLGATVLFRHKLKDSPPQPFYLMYVLSTATIIWGLLSGTWFGSEKISHLPFLKIFIVPQLYSFSDLSQSFVMKLTFIIGAVHLSVARFMAAMKRINSPTAIAEFGWIAILWGIFFVANNLILGTPIKGFVLPMIGVGSFVVAFFANFQKNIIKGFLISLGNLPLDIISSFSDIVSYIRLFAVGFATVIVATSFNNMAAGVGVSSVFSSAITAVILIFGHGLNIVLGMMAVLVHGVRLNMLEFSGHIGIEWSGRPYTPFKE